MTALCSSTTSSSSQQAAGETVFNELKQTYIVCVISCNVCLIAPRWSLFFQITIFCSQGTAAHLSWLRPGRSKITAELRRRQRHLQLQPRPESSCYRSVFHRLLNKVSFFMLKNETPFIFLPIGVDVTLFAHRYLTATAHKCARH